MSEQPKDNVNEDLKDVAGGRRIDLDTGTGDGGTGEGEGTPKLNKPTTDDQSPDVGTTR